MTRPKASRWVALLAGSVPTVVAASAHGYEAEVEASAEAQSYTVASPFGDPEVRRRRYTHTLGLAIYDIDGNRDWRAPELFWRSRLRLDADLGQENDERNPARDGRYVPGLEQAPIDLMYAHLEGRGYLGGLLGFRLGRQYVTDVLGFWSFDGALLRLTLPVFVELEGYAGFEQRGGLPMLSTQRFEADGVYRGDRTGLEVNQRPEVLDSSELAPAFGFALQSAGVHWMRARLSYRRVLQHDTVNVSPFPTPDDARTVDAMRVSSDRVGVAMRADESGLGGVSGEMAYDLYGQRLSEAAAGVDWYATERLTFGARADYWRPVFDGDSIYNWFSYSGTTSLLGRAEVTSWRRLDVAASGGVRLYHTEGDPETYAEQLDREASGWLLDHVASLSGQYRWSDGSLALHGVGEAGERGRRVGADVTARRQFDGGLYDALVTLSVYDWSDALRPTRDATSFSYVLGGGMSPGGLFSEGRLGLQWEHAVNRLVGQRFRLLATLDFTLLRTVL